MNSELDKQLDEIPALSDPDGGTARVTRPWLVRVNYNGQDYQATMHTTCKKRAVVFMIATLITVLKKNGVSANKNDIKLIDVKLEES